MSDDLNTIRARWAGRGWHCDETWDSTNYCGEIRLIAESGELLLDLDEPNAAEVDLLRIVGAAPGDIAALLAELAAARTLAEAVASLPSIAQETAVEAALTAYEAARADSRKSPI